MSFQRSSYTSKGTYYIAVEISHLLNHYVHYERRVSVIWWESPDIPNVLDECPTPHFSLFFSHSPFGPSLTLSVNLRGWVSQSNRKQLSIRRLVKTRTPVWTRLGANIHRTMVATSYKDVRHTCPCCTVKATLNLPVYTHGLIHITFGALFNGPILGMGL